MLGLPILFAAPALHAQSGPAPSAEELAAQISALKQDYEKRIAALEAQLASLETKARDAAPAAPPAMKSGDNSFNPALGLVLAGRFSDYSGDAAGLPGFQLGHESSRPDEGFALGHSELTLSGNIDDKFRGGLTLGLGVHADEPTEVELEEAYVETLPGSGIPDGFRLKAGRALWTFGYLNEHHVHADDFSDRPLPYRAFLDGAYNDDGLEFSVVLPGELYREAGVGLFRGGDTPFGGSETGREAWSAYARLGGDIGRDSAWRIGGYMLDGEAVSRSGSAHAHAHGEDGHGHEDEHDHEGENEHHEDEEHHGEEENGHHDEHHAHADFFSEGAFSGDTRLYGADFRFTWAPTGNARDSELILQGEYFRRRESGFYTLQTSGDVCADSDHHEECEEHVEHVTEAHVVEHVEDVVERLNGDSSGWYVQAVYKFLPRWRVGARYSRLLPPDDAELGYDLSTISTMVDWTNSEFGRIRFQYNQESLGQERDKQFILQYVMSLGAHAAHSF